MQRRNWFPVVVVTVAVVAAALLVAPSALGQAQIKISDTANIKFGILLQPQADWSEAATAVGGYTQNLMLRRTRLLVGGQFTKNLFFFAETENSRLGGSTTGGKNLASGFQMLDAVAEWRVSKAFNLQGGLIRVPTSREALKSSPTEFMLDFGVFAFTQSGAVGSNSGRDTGFMARGYFLDDKLEYRLGAFQGNRNGSSFENPTGNNAFRYVGRLQYNIFDSELYNFVSYPGGYLGTKKILNFGIAYDQQADYFGVTADMYLDIPTTLGSVEGTATWAHVDGGAYVPTLVKQDYYQAEFGVYAKGVKLGPWARYERREFADNSKNENRYSAGIGWFPYGWNFNVKAGYVRVEPNSGFTTNQVTLQLQLYYF